MKIPRRLFRSAGIGLLASVMLLMGLWRYELSAPHLYWSDGSTMWDRTMSFREKSSYWPYQTKYAVFHDGYSIKNDSGKVLKETHWISLAIWNGDGIDGIRVYARNNREDVLVFPDKKRGFIYTPGSGHMTDATGGIWRTVRVSDKRFINLGVQPPDETTSLRIVVTDARKNVTEASVAMESIRR